MDEEYEDYCILMMVKQYKSSSVQLTSHRGNTGQLESGTEQPPETGQQLTGSNNAVCQTMERSERFNGCVKKKKIDKRSKGKRGETS
jgi:hypothetical protein